MSWKTFLDWLAAPGIVLEFVEYDEPIVERHVHLHGRDTKELLLQ